MQNKEEDIMSLVTIIYQAILFSGVGLAVILLVSYIIYSFKKDKKPAYANYSLNQNIEKQPALRPTFVNERKPIATNLKEKELVRQPVERIERENFIQKRNSSRRTQIILRENRYQVLNQNPILKDNSRIKTQNVSNRTIVSNKTFDYYSA